jgi:glycine oxidase
MADGRFDVIVVGQGLAGTTLAWTLTEAGQRVLVVDAEPAVTSSKIAAGLITPITGKRLALSWQGDMFLPVAQAFYRAIEARTGRRFFHDRSTVRLFQSAEETSHWAQRCDQPAFQAHLVDPQPVPAIDPGVAEAPFGGFEMASAQLDVAGYLDASRAVLEYAPMQLDWARDVMLTAGGVEVQGIKARRLVSCEGFAATRNPYFSWVPFNPAKGDILTIRVDRPLPRVCLQCGIWVAPTGDPRVFAVGSTYGWGATDEVPTTAARAEIEGKLLAFFRVPYEVIGHRAAVRPIIRQSKALVGLHPLHEQLGYFNGLGSKGASIAPWFARLFAAHLVDAAPLPQTVDLRANYTMRA